MKGPIRRTLRRSAAAIALAALVLGSCAHRPELIPDAHYVAMGSSFAAGTAIGGVKPGTPVRCGRSPLNYASLLAARLNLHLDDQTCGGATTAHIMGPWDELAPQINAVNADTRLVTITIGGNDLGYVMNLFAATCSATEGYVIGGVKRPCPVMKLPAAKDFARLESSLRALAREVHSRAPAARLIFVQYVELVPERPCAALRLSPEGAVATRTIGRQLAAITARAAKAERAEVLDAYTLSRGHSLCDAKPWSAGPKPLGPEANTPWHPNAAGHAAIAEALAQRLGG